MVRSSSRLHGEVLHSSSPITLRTAAGSFHTGTMLDNIVQATLRKPNIPIVRPALSKHPTQTVFDISVFLSRCPSVVVCSVAGTNPPSRKTVEWLFYWSHNQLPAWRRTATKNGFWVANGKDESSPWTQEYVEWVRCSSALRITSAPLSRGKGMCALRVTTPVAS